MRKYILTIYNKIMHYSNKKSAPYILAACAFCEGIFFVIPPDVFLTPICLCKPKRAYFFATICSISSVLGGMVGYLLGYLIFKYIGIKLINYFHYTAEFNYISQFYKEYDAWAIFIGGFTPIPYKFIAMFSGFVQVNLWVFIIMSLLSRSLRFFMISTFIFFLGEKAKPLIENHIGKITLAITIILIVIVYLVFM